MQIICASDELIKINIDSYLTDKQVALSAFIYGTQNFLYFIAGCIFFSKAHDTTHLQSCNENSLWNFYIYVWTSF